MILLAIVKISFPIISYLISRFLITKATEEELREYNTKIKHSMILFLPFLFLSNNLLYLISLVAILTLIFKKRYIFLALLISVLQLISGEVTVIAAIIFNSLIGLTEFIENGRNS